MPLPIPVRVSREKSPNLALRVGSFRLTNGGQERLRGDDAAEENTQTKAYGARLRVNLQCRSSLAILRASLRKPRGSRDDASPESVLAMADRFPAILSAGCVSSRDQDLRRSRSRARRGLIYVSREPGLRGAAITRRDIGRRSEFPLTIGGSAPLATPESSTVSATALGTRSVELSIQAGARTYYVKGGTVPMGFGVPQRSSSYRRTGRLPKSQGVASCLPCRRPVRRHGQRSWLVPSLTSPCLARMRARRF